MDSLTLTLVIVIFLCCLGLHFATLIVLIPQPPIKSPTVPPIKWHIFMPVLRQNVAIARLMRIERI
jgi:hypothetical protein